MTPWRTSDAGPPDDGDLAEARELRFAIEGIKDYAIFMLDAGGHVRSWNAGARALKGYAPEEIIGSHLSRFYAPEDVARPAALLERARREGRVEDEGWRVRKDGSRFWADVVITPVVGADGSLHGFVKVTRDLTDRRAAEEELRASEARLRESEQRARESDQRLRLMIESVRDHAIFALDPDGRIASWNPGAERLKGYRADEAIGRSFEIFYPPADIAAGKPAKELRDAAALGRVEDEGWRVRKDGSRFFANVVLSAMRAKDGALVGFTKVTRDVTERKRAEEERAARARQQVTLAALGQHALATRDLDALMARAVELAADTLDAEAVEVVELLPDGRGLARRAGVGPASTAPLDAAAAEAVARDAPGVPGERAGLAPASTVHVPIRASLDGPPLGVLAARARDGESFSTDEVAFLRASASIVGTAIGRRLAEERMTEAAREAARERARSEQAEGAVRARDEFILVAAHELRTPLTALQLKLEGVRLLLRAPLTEPGAAAKADARVESALGQGRRLKTLIDRLLDVSRMAAGRLELSRERVDLAELAREVVDGLREHAAAAGSELRLRVEGGATAGEWDRARVEQVLVNLLSNALKYGAGKPVDVTVEGAGGVARFSVADRGIGLSEVDLGRLFGRFERMAPVRHYAGLGLGLYISRHLVEAHGGAIRVASRPGEGATFTIELPTTTTATPREGAPRPPPARGAEEPTP